LSKIEVLSCAGVMGYVTLQPGMRVRKFWTNIVFISSGKVEMGEGFVSLANIFIRSAST